ncbi:hypothetical protein H0E87_001000 [Populus deltoides]|uniref:Uncharacterized protein n=1 Tax=Populus deltoides TaxID=3696 RepID=A0A8T2ZPA3_POPDE|nr:hypothetical protein H0E87_001000 [Populus deltoides]
MMLGGEMVLSIRFVESNAIDLTAMVDGVVMVNQVVRFMIVGGRGGGTSLIGIVPPGISSKYFGELWELTVKASNGL